MKPQSSFFAIVCSTMLLALASCEDPSVSNPSGANPSGTTPSGTNPSGSQVSGTIDGHDYVDLGLPSGTLWATCNVGADSPEEYGDYFAWGETQPKSSYTWDYLTYCTDYYDMRDASFSKYNESDGKTVLEASDDAATVNWGTNWRMPTDDEIYELYTKSNGVWITKGDQNGRLFTGPNGNTVFLPAAGHYYERSLYGAGNYGHYWSSSLDTNYSSPSLACNLNFNSDGLDWGYSYSFSYFRYYGLSVRPVVR